MMKRWFLFATVLVAGLMVLAGCGQQVTAADIVQHMRDTAAQTDSAHLVLTVGGNINGQAANAVLGGTKLTDMKGDVTAEIWYQKPNLLRVQVLSSTTDRAQLTGAVLVDDGTYLWAYDPNSKIAYKLDTSALHELGGKANIPANLQDLLANPNLETAINQLLALTDYTLGPNEQVGQFQTYRLDLKPKADSSVAKLVPDAQATLWIDQVTWAPVKATLTASQGSGHMEMTTLELNKPAAAGTFQFTMPAGGGHVVDLSGMVPHSVTLAQARDQAQTGGYHLLEPSYVPAGATLVQVMASRGLMGSGASVTLNYSAGSSDPTFWISEVNGGANPLGKPQSGDSATGAPATPAQTVTVRGVDGHFSSHAEKGQTGALLWWKEKGTNLTVAIGGQATQAELLKIAAGLK